MNEGYSNQKLNDICHRSTDMQSGGET